jgi:hypothetical protein
MSPSTWAVVSTGIRGERADTSAAGAARAAPCPAAWGWPPGAPGAGLGVAAGVICGNRPAAFPAPTSVLATGGPVISGNRPAAFPAPMTVTRVAFPLGGGPSGSEPG